MSENTRSIKKNDVTDEEASNYLLQVSALLNEINRLEEEKDDFNKELNKQIKAEEKKLESIRVILNDGVVLTLHNFMDKTTHEIIWKDDDGDEVERTPFDDADWKIWEKQYGPKQKPLFDNEDPAATSDSTKLVPYDGVIIDAESEDIPPDVSSTWTADFNEHGEEEVEAEREAS